MPKSTIAALVAGAVLIIAGLATAATPAVGPSGYRLLDNIAIPDGNSDYVTFDNFAKRVLLARSLNIVAVDVATGKVTPSLATAMGGHIALAVDGGKQIAITNGGSNSVTFVDGKTGAALGSAPAPSFPDSGGVDPATGYFLAVSHSAGVVTVIDPVSHTVKGSITVGGTLEGIVADGAGRAYVNVESKGQVAALDLKTFTVADTFTMDGCEGPTGIVYDKQTKLIVSACDGLTEVLDAKTGKTVASIKNGGGPDMAAFYDKGQLAFIPAGADGTLEVISLAGGKPTLVENIPTQAGARAVAVDQATGKVFLPVSETAPPPPGGRRGAAVPGSFKLMVLGK